MQRSTTVARPVPHRSGSAIVTLLLTAVVAATASGQDDDRLEWTRLPDYPREVGVAGPFVGVDRGAMLVLGGANFPPPIWSASKQWLDTAVVLVRTPDGFAWRNGGRLPSPRAYGISVATRSAPPDEEGNATEDPTARGVLLAGGHDGTRVCGEAWWASFDANTGKIRFRSAPPLPTPLAYASAARLGDRIWVLGGTTGDSLATATNRTWWLDLRTPEDGWRQGPPCPGPTRAFAIACVQHDGVAPRLYWMSGRRQGTHGVELLRDCWELAPDRAQPWRRRADLPRCVMAGTAAAVGQSHVFVFGGDAGEHFGRADELRDDHPGFTRGSLAYHPITDTWIEAGATPQNQVTTWAVPAFGGVVIPSGEIRPRVRTRAVWLVTPRASEPAFGIVNTVVVGVYLLAMLGIGFWFARSHRGTDDFFRGGQRIPFWAAGLSIFATMLSSITFMAIPAKVFATDWVYIVGNLMILAVVPLVIRMFLPFFRRIDATSAYEYLEKRFDGAVRLVGSTQFIIFQIARMAVVLLLPALALEVVTSLDRTACILAMGGLSILYCTAGGIRAVIWTDVVQTFVLLGGALMTLLVVCAEVGVGAIVDEASAAGKLRIANPGWDATAIAPVLWVIVIGTVLSNLVQYGSDQSVVQRYMTTETEAKARYAIWTNGVMSVVASFLFFGVGTALWAFYRSHPERLDPTFRTDQIFPLFIAHELPVGVAGLVVAGIFAAAQSTVSTSMNSISTALVTDFWRKLRPGDDDRRLLVVGRVLTAVMGIVGTGAALWLAQVETRSLWDTFMRYLGLLTSVLGGLFLLGILTRRANATGALIGAAVATGVLWWVVDVGVSFFLFAGIGAGTTMLVGWLASLVVPGARCTQGLTLRSSRSS